VPPPARFKECPAKCFEVVLELPWPYIEEKSSTVRCRKPVDPVGRNGERLVGLEGTGRDRNEEANGGLAHSEACLRVGNPPW